MINKISPQEEIRLRIGAREFLTNKDDMLDLFELAKIQSKNRPTQTDKGKIAESALRAWLTQFLPRRYAVTSGYIISQGSQQEERLLHYDVIIYDAINAPILWVEKDLDNSELGKVRALPAEYVYGVMEVKSSFTKEACKEAKEKLWQLSPLLEKTDSPDEPYKRFLPSSFCMGMVFFELRNKDKNNIKILEELIPKKWPHDLRGYWGGIVLQAEGKDRDLTGKISFLNSENPIDNLGDLVQVAIVGNIKIGESKYFSAMIDWTLTNFATFAFDLIALMNGTYRGGFISSFHGLPFGVSSSEKSSEVQKK